MTAPFIVTGSASGIGAALADRLVRAGHDVIGWDLRVTENPAVSSVVVDLTDGDSIAAAAAEGPAQIAGLANVAGVPGTLAPDLVLAVNVGGPVGVVRALAERMEPGGAIVNVASLAADRNVIDDAGIAALFDAAESGSIAAWSQSHPLDGAAAYDTSKRFLVDWSVAVAAQLLSRRVRVVSVSPGPTETPILGDFVTSMGEDAIGRSRSAVGRHGTADEVAAVVQFALSHDASWLSGVDLRVDGGLSGLRRAASLPASSLFRSNETAGR